MRDKAANYTSSNNLCTELTPFIFKLRDDYGTIKLHNIPMAYVVDLWRKVEDILSRGQQQRVLPWVILY